MSAKLRKQALQLLAEQPLTLRELADKMELKEKRAFKVLRNLFENGQINMFMDDDRKRRYKAL